MTQLFAQLADLFFDAGHVLPGLCFVWAYNRGIATFRQPVLIYNPVAGKIRRNPEAILQRTKAALGRARLVPQLLPTSAPGQAGSLARQAIVDGADLILVLGGDGTINEALQGVANTGVPMGVLPGGTANCLAMELGLGSNVERAAERLATCNVVPISLGQVTTERAGSRFFLLMCGAGLDAAIVKEVHAGLKARTGKLAYWVAGLAQFRRSVRPMLVALDGERHACGFALVSRGRNYGGDMEIASGASLRRDDFEVVLFQGSHPLRYAFYMLGVGAKRVQRLPGVRTSYATSVEILSASPSQIDGEFLGSEPLKITIVPGALTLLMPVAYG
ncbi:MAG: diacylglycerol kinase family protein [Acidobacteriota bacterium]